MKKSLFVILALCLFISCTETPKKEGVFNLLPVPKQFDISGISSLTPDAIKKYYLEGEIKLPTTAASLSQLTSVVNKNEADILFNIDENLEVKAEGYTLEISEDKIHITGKDVAGLFYGLKTLEQLIEDATDQEANLPICSITDYPLLAYRAIHLDVKHHLETTDYYYTLIDKLARYKINGIIAEMEDKLGYVRQPKVASADALSIEEWQKLSDYAKARNIEISPLIQGLGHASFVLKHPEYKDLRDNLESDWAFNPLDPKTYAVQFDLYLDAIEATPHGKYLHVGGDEVHTTGRNSGKSALELQLTWLGKVSKFAEEHNRIPIFWDDMPLKQAEVYYPMFQPGLTQKEVDSIWNKNEHKLVAFLDKFPKNCIYMRWNYSSPEALGNVKAMQWFSDHDLQVMGATAGQTRWVLMPQQESNMENIRSFAVNSIDNNLNGLLLTLWDDDSPHFELYNRSIIAFAEYTWAGDKRNKKAIKTAYRQREFSNALADSSFAFIDALEKPVAFWKNALLKGNKRNYLLTMENPLEDGVIDLPFKTEKGAWTKKYQTRLTEAELVLQTVDSVSVKIELAKSKAVRNSYTLEVYEQVNTISGFTPKLLLALKAYDDATNSNEKLEVIDRLKNLQKDFKIARENLEGVYAKTRILNKPENYILDQDHHHHLANQSLNFDWQFQTEMKFFEKLEKELESTIHLLDLDHLNK